MMEYNDEKNVNIAPDGPETEESAEMQDEIRFFAEEPDAATDADLNARADERAAEENAAEAEACRMDDGVDFDLDMDPDFSVDSDGIGMGNEGVAVSLRERLTALRENCRALSERIADDMRATNGNPYIRATTTYRYEILRNKKDTEPVDVFEFRKTSGASLRAMAITTAIVAAADVAVARFLKRK